MTNIDPELQLIARYGDNIAFWVKQADKLNCMGKHKLAESFYIIASGWMRKRQMLRLCHTYSCLLENRL